MNVGFDLVHSVVARLKNVKPGRKDQWSALCPAHDDHQASLSISRGGDGRVLLHCHAGCQVGSILQAIGLTNQDLFPEVAKTETRARIVATYDYRDARGHLVFQTVRFDPKDFRQRRPNGQGEWIWNLKDTPRVLYRLPELLATELNALVCIAEGEKDVDRLVSLGFVSTTNPLGAGKWDKLDSDAALNGRRVAIFADNDGPGRAHAHAVAQHLKGRVTEVRVVAVPEGYKDVSAWCDAQVGRSRVDLRGQLQAAIAAAPVFQVETSAAEVNAAREKAPTTREGLIAYGQRDPKTGKLVLHPRQTLPTAQTFVREYFHQNGEPTLIHYGGQFFSWSDNRYGELEDGVLRHQFQPWLHEALRYYQAPGAKAPRLIPFDSNPTTVNAALDTLRGLVHLPASITPPAWLGDAAAGIEPRDILTCRSINLHLPTGDRLSPTPRLFAVNALTFDYEPEAAPPQDWLNFLTQLWDDDCQQIDLLQEWFGYSLTADTRQQKMLLLVGPKRSGKGTIARILARLVGAANVCGPTTSSLARPFGLQPLLGKSLAIVSDARFTGRDLPVVVERLLCISGEDALSVDRKYMTSVTMKLPTRFMFLTNELPRLSDVSGALAGRFLILRLSESYYGREDLALTDKLANQLPGILNWAIAGWHRLRERGRFVPPASTEDAVREMEDLASPVLAFIRERCVIAPNERVRVDDMYATWKDWCDREGREAPGTKQIFGRNLLAAEARVRCRRSTGDVRFYHGISLIPASI